MNAFTTDIRAALGRCHAAPREQRRIVVRPYRVRTAGPDVHQLLVMCKPELCHALDGPHGESVAALVFGTLADQGVEVGAAVVVSSAYARATGLVRAHYPLLNAVSRHGLAVVRPAARSALLARFPGFRDAQHRILGGHQFLRAFPEFAPRSLDVLVQNLRRCKVAAGVYADEAGVDDVPWLLLNGFHPDQVEHFERPGGALVILECRSAIPLAHLRRTVIGATDPRQAAAGSLRAMLVDRPDVMPGPVSASRNALHAVPGSVEAMFAIARYFDEPLAATTFGARLAGGGVDLSRVAALSANPDVAVGSSGGPLFDVTEDLGVDEAVEIVLRSIGTDRAGIGS